MSLATIVKVRNENWHQVFIYLFCLRGAKLFSLSYYGFLLLILYAEAGWLSTIKEVCINCELLGASVWSSTWRLASSLSASLFCKWGWGAAAAAVVVVGGWTCCRDSSVPGFCLAQQRGPTESIFLHPLRPPPPPLQLLHLSEHAMPRLNYGVCYRKVSLVTVSCAASSGIWRPQLKGSWEWKRFISVMQLLEM